MKYFRVHYEDKKGIPFAESGTSTILPLATSRERTHLLKNGLTVRTKYITDYLANDVGARLCSTKMRNVLEGVKGEQDSWTFLEVPIKTPSGVLPFYILRFLRSDMTIIDKERSIMNGDMVVKPVLSKAHVAGRHVFTMPGDEDVIWFVSDAARNALLNAGCTGTEFSKVPVL